MRIGKVIGRVTLSRCYDTLTGGRFLLVSVQDRFALAGEKRRTAETVIVYDHLGSREGDLIAFSESREATQPFYPEKRVPIDAYNSAILDAVNVELRI
jgi:microcompartment protein CcmK/EutM